MREVQRGLIQKVAVAVMQDIWGQYKFDSRIIWTLKRRGRREEGSMIKKSVSALKQESYSAGIFSDNVNLILI